MFPFIIFNLTQNTHKPPPHVFHVELRKSSKSKKSSLLTWFLNSAFNFVIKFYLTCRCNVNGFQTTNPHIRWLVFLDKCQFVHIFRLKMSSSKCSQNSSNIKNAFCFYLVNWDTKYMPHQYNKGWKLVLFFVPPI
jgi:hypothetical protein